MHDKKQTKKEFGRFFRPREIRGGETLRSFDLQCFRERRGA